MFAAILSGLFWTILNGPKAITQRFGIVHVEYASQQRTPKDSAAWYKEVIAANGAIL